MRKDGKLQEFHLPTPFVFPERSSRQLLYRNSRFPNNHPGYNRLQTVPELPYYTTTTLFIPMISIFAQTTIQIFFCTSLNTLKTGIWRCFARREASASPFIDLPTNPFPPLNASFFNKKGGWKNSTPFLKNICKTNSCYPINIPDFDKPTYRHHSFAKHQAGSAE